MARETRGDFYPVPIVDQNTRPGAITRLIVFVVVLTGAAIVFGLFRERLGDPFLLGMLGVLAMIGVGYLFATRHRLRSDRAALDHATNCRRPSSIRWRRACWSPTPRAASSTPTAPMPT